MVVSRKDSLKCELKFGDIKIKQVKKFNYLGSMLTEDGKCDTEIQRRIGIAKDAFQKLSKVLTNRKMTIKTKKRVLDCYVTRGGSRIFCDRVELRRSRNGYTGVRGRSPRKIFLGPRPFIFEGTPFFSTVFGPRP